MSTLKNKKILLTGGAGFLGDFVKNELIKKGVDEEDIFIPRSSDYDLRIIENCKRVVKDIKIVIHLAAKVGGIGYNKANPGSLFYDNIIMGVQLMEAARLEGIEKFITVGTICAYPKFTPVPFKEKNLWIGYPEETNAPYGLAKKMLLVQGRAYRQQYGFNAIYLLLVNLYGPGDNFNLESSHVIPAIMRKMHEAKLAGKDKVEIWGTGKASREFVYVEDAAQGIVLATEKYGKGEPINIGAGMEITIKNLVEKIKEVVGYKGEIVWDTSKPDGQPRRCLDISLAQKEFGFKASTDFNQGLKKTYEWFVKHNSV